MTREETFHCHVLQSASHLAYTRLSVRHTNTSNAILSRLLGSTLPLRSFWSDWFSFGFLSLTSNVRFFGQPCTRKAPNSNFVHIRDRQWSISITSSRVWTQAIHIRGMGFATKVLSLSDLIRRIGSSFGQVSSSAVANSARQLLDSIMKVSTTQKSYDLVDISSSLTV